MRPELNAMPSFDQINLGATFLQSAVIIAFAIALFGVWRTSRRPLTRDIAAYWSLFAGGAVVNVMSSWSGAIWHDRALSLTLTTVVVALQGAAIGYARSALRSLTTPDARRPRVLRVVTLGAAAFALHGAGVAAFLHWWPDLRLERVLWSRSVHVLVLIIPAVLAWRALARSGQNRDSVLLLVAGWSALAFRALVEWGFAFQVGRPPLPVAVVIGAIVLNVVAMMALGVTTLLAVSTEAYGLLVRQSELLQQTQRRLSRVRRMESLGQLAGGVAHDFNNVLAVIQLSASDGLERPDAEGKQEALDLISRSSDRGRELVQQLLTFAKQQPERVERFDAAARIDAMGAMLVRLTGERSYTMESSATSALIRMDPSQFDQIVLNLIINARDATGAGGRVTVSLADGELPAHLATHEPSSVEGLRLCVTDTGSGIPADVLPNIFEPFFSTKNDRGTGLGLATVRSIVMRAGGEIAVRSELGLGSTFEVILPKAS